MISFDPNCIPCQAKKKQLLQQYDTFKELTKKRANAIKNTFVTYLDEEDQKWRIIPANQSDGIKVYEYITPD